MQVGRGESYRTDFREGTNYLQTLPRHLTRLPGPPADYR